MSFICGDCHKEHKVPTHEEDKGGQPCIDALVRERDALVLQVRAFEAVVNVAKDFERGDIHPIALPLWNRLQAALADTTKVVTDKRNHEHQWGEWGADRVMAGMAGEWRTCSVCKLVEKRKCECWATPLEPGSICGQCGVRV